MEMMGIMEKLKYSLLKNNEYKTLGGEKLVYLEGLGTALGQVPGVVWEAVHLLTAIVGFWFAYKLKDNKTLMWAFVLYGLTGILNTLVHLNLLHSYAVHIVESVLVFVAVVLVGTSMTKK